MPLRLLLVGAAYPEQDFLSEARADGQAIHVEAVGEEEPDERQARLTG